MKHPYRVGRNLWWTCLLVLCLPVYQAMAESGWRVGVARVTITPETPLWMAGYSSRTQEASGKYSDLYVRVCALEDAAGARAVLVSLDLIGVDRALSQAICQSLEQRCGLQRSQIALCFSHTHSGPVVANNLASLHYRLLNDEQRQRIDQYAVWVQQRIVDGVQQAIGNLQPCELAWGSGTASFATNRRNNPEAKVPELRAANQLQGPCDHDVPVLAARGADGTWKSIVLGYACHGTVLADYSWCGDYPGFASSDLETRFTGCVAQFWAGCGADQNPLPRRKLELAQQYGGQLAQAVVDVLSREGGTSPLPSVLKTFYVEVPLPLDAVATQEQLQQAAQSTDRYQRACAELQLERLAAGQELPATYPFPVQLWVLGDVAGNVAGNVARNHVQWIFLGGEVVVDYAVRLKTELRGKQTWVAGYANDVMAYIPSQRVLAEGGYEGKDAMVYYGLSGVWSPQVEPLVVEAVHALVRSADAEHAVDGGEAVDGGAGVDPHVR